MGRIQDYLTREGWRRDRVQTREDLGKIISKINSNQRGDVGSEIAASLALVGGLGLLLVGAGEHIYGFVSNDPQSISHAYLNYKLGGSVTAAGVFGALTSNWFDSHPY